MTKVLTEQELPKFVKSLVQGRADVCIAVAFWGKDAITRLGLNQAAGGRILCNPLLGYCNPDVIKELQKSFEVFAHPKLHAKVYMTTERATVGSSNASSNGLSQDFEGTTGFRELNLGSDDPAILKQLNDWFEARWKEKIEITSDMFGARPPGLPVPPKSGSLIQAATQNQDYFRSKPIYLMLYKQFVDRDTRAQIKNEVRKLKVGNFALKHSMRRPSTPHGDSKTEVESVFGTYTEYVGWGKCFPRDCDAWLIDISKVRKAKVWGIFRSYTDTNLRLPTRPDVDLAFKRSCINMDGPSFLLADEDKQLLQDRFDDLWKHANGCDVDCVRVLAFDAASDILSRYPLERTTMFEKVSEVTHTDEEWRRLLTPEQYRVMRAHGTEARGSCALDHEKRPGVFVCAGCGQRLFVSAKKFESGTGWPSFNDPLEGAVENTDDRSHGMTRTEVHCSRCGSHLGHVFPDGPPPTHLRYCVNGVAMNFLPE